MKQINYQTGVFKTIASYQTPEALPEASNLLRNAIIRCNYKIVNQTLTTIQFKTPVAFTDWGFKMTASLTQTGNGTFVKIEGKAVVPISFDILGACKKKISALETYL